MTTTNTAEPVNNSPGLSPPEAATPITTTAPYSAFQPWQKRWIIAVVAFGGWFSSLSSFIYFPAIPALAADLGVGVEKINLTVTSYLIMSGVFPALVGNAADKLGRRPVFLATLAVYVAANVGLALQNSFGLLFFLRMLQSAGISGTYSVTYGVIGDLFTPAERGGYSGIISFFLNTPPSIGPVISGLLLLRWDWRAIFWFLSIISPCCLLTMTLFLPETSRVVVGNGSIHPTGVYRALIPILAPPPGNDEEQQRLQISEKPKSTSGFPNPLACLLLLRHRRTAIVVVCMGVHYTIYSCLQASLSTLFTEIYQVSGLVSGLTYLPFGVACAIAAFGTGTYNTVGTTAPIDQTADVHQAKSLTGTTGIQLKRKGCQSIKRETMTSAASRSNTLVSGASSFRSPYVHFSSWHMAGRSSKGRIWPRRLFCSFLLGLQSRVYSRG